MADFFAADEATQQRRIESMRGKDVLFITCFLASYLYDRDIPNIKRIASWGVNLHMVFGQSDDEKKAKKRFEVRLMDFTERKDSRDLWHGSVQHSTYHTVNGRFSAQTRTIFHCSLVPFPLLGPLTR